MIINILLFKKLLIIKSLRSIYCSKFTKGEELSGVNQDVVSGVYGVDQGDGSSKKDLYLSNYSPSQEYKNKYKRKISMVQFGLKDYPIAIFNKEMEDFGLAIDGNDEINPNNLKIKLKEVTTKNIDKFFFILHHGMKCNAVLKDITKKYRSVTTGGVLQLTSIMDVDNSNLTIQKIIPNSRENLVKIIHNNKCLTAGVINKRNNPRLERFEKMYKNQNRFDNYRYESPKERMEKERMEMERMEEERKEIENSLLEENEDRDDKNVYASFETCVDSDFQFWSIETKVEKYKKWGLLEEQRTSQMFSRNEKDSKNAHLILQNNDLEDATRYLESLLEYYTKCKNERFIQ